MKKEYAFLFFWIFGVMLAHAVLIGVVLEIPLERSFSTSQTYLMSVTGGVGAGMFLRFSNTAFVLPLAAVISVLVVGGDAHGLWNDLHPDMWARRFHGVSWSLSIFFVVTPILLWKDLGPRRG